jgi:hypothetical protein
VKRGKGRADIVELAVADLSMSYEGRERPVLVIAAHLDHVVDRPGAVVGDCRPSSPRASPRTAR